MRAVARNLPKVRVHDPKHTFVRRLRAAGVSFEADEDAVVTRPYARLALDGRGSRL
jgi:hypothetical protein